MKLYELHYQPKKVNANGVEKYQPFGCINFHARWGIKAKLTLAIKNKWSTGWMKAWFYYNVPAHLCVQGGKAMYHLHSHMCSLDFWAEPPFDCGDDDSGDTAFVWATKFIGGQDAMEEFVACGMHPLAAGVGFNKVATLVTSVSKLKVPLLKFVAVRKNDEDDVQFLARVELEAEGIMGSYTCPEHEACIMSLHNGVLLNRVFELAEVAYEPRLEPDTEEFTEASKKRKMDAAGKNMSKHARALGKKKVETAKAIVQPGKTCTLQGKGAALQGKGGLKRPSDADVASAWPAK
jgi:hypothetical protein